MSHEIGTWQFFFQTNRLNSGSDSVMIGSTINTLPHTIMIVIMTWAV